MSETTRLSAQELEAAIQKESERFREHYHWLEQHMPPRFFELVDPSSVLLIVHNFMEFHLNDYFSHIHLKNSAFALSLESPDADLKVLKHYRSAGIKNYRSFVSNALPPFPKATSPLRITRIVFNDHVEAQSNESLSPEKENALFEHVHQRNPHVTAADVHQLLGQLGPLFLKAMSEERLITVLDLFFRAQSRDHCQYEVKRLEEWAEHKETPSFQVLLAWRNVPRYNFLYRLSEMIYRHGLVMKRVNATHIDPYSSQSILLLSLGLHGMKGGAAWDEANLEDFLKELVTCKYFEGLPLIDQTFVAPRLLTGNQGNLLKSMIYFVQQSLVCVDLNVYTLDHVEEALCRHPELTTVLMNAFEAKFHPTQCDLTRYSTLKEKALTLINHLDTGHALNDTRRKNILKQTLFMVEYTLKTNFYRNNKTAFSFRLDPIYLDHLPCERKEKFPELPYALFFIKGFYFLGFHIRFRDLSRGGLRTVFPQKTEQMLAERNNVFAECYNLAYTQNKKNKDIPEGGSKAIIFLEPYPHLQAEEESYKKEMEEGGLTPEAIEQNIQRIHSDHKLATLYQAQRSYIESLLSLVNCEPDGKLRAKDIVDYWKRPEYLYLGPDENMHNSMIEWIADFSKRYAYKPGSAFISSKPSTGINHKEFGVTSLGVNVYMEELLQFMGINPLKQTFTIKMSGGPDGDVAGNQMENLYQYYRDTAKLVATIDVSGTICDPQGLVLEHIHTLFVEGKPIRFYPKEALHEGGFLLDTTAKKEESAYAQTTLCTHKKGNALVEEWLSGNAMNALLRHNVHQTPADIFIPGGGRPRTLSEANCTDFLDNEGKPTARAIVEGANLYLTPWARRFLEERGVLIIKDSSANKGGVICSSFEVLCCLTLSEEEFLKEKATLVAEILEIIKDKARAEAKLLLRTHQETGTPLTLLSDQVSERINRYKDELLAYLQTVSLSHDPHDPFSRCLFNHAPPLLRTKYAERLLKEVPDVHQKAIIASHIASRVVYYRGLSWAPSITDVLPLIAQDPQIIG